MIAIIDYDAGNIKSVEKAVQFLGGEAVLTGDPEVILSADKAILPGVGSFGDAMSRIRSAGLEPVIHEFVESGKPFLGICLGLQLLFSESEESPGVKGLSLLSGKIRRIPEKEGLPVPQIGWNDISVKKASKLLDGVSGAYVYFVHSYYLECDDPADVAATTEYGVTIHAAVERGNLFACQFHPEKSSAAGLRILSNFLAL